MAWQVELMGWPVGSIGWPGGHPAAVGRHGAGGREACVEGAGRMRWVAGRDAGGYGEAWTGFGTWPAACPARRPCIAGERRDSLARMGIALLRSVLRSDLRVIIALLCLALARSAPAAGNAEIAAAGARDRRTPIAGANRTAIIAPSGANREDPIARANPFRNKELLAMCRAVGESGIQARRTFCREIIPKPLSGVCWESVKSSIQYWSNLCYEWFGDW